MKYLRSGIVFVIIINCVTSGCITTNYYTARTLEKGKTVMTPGIDNLIWIETDEGLIPKDVYFTPSLGFAAGLPWRLETGMRFYLPYILEANLRHQLNPSTFKLFDISVNVHVGACLGNEMKYISHPYYKYGLTISKEIYTLQPYFSYYLNKNYFVENKSDGLYDFSIICFGMAIPLQDILIFPEWNYYTNIEADKGFLSFGMGARVPLKKSK
jgi:hypothetical protein